MKSRPSENEYRMLATDEPMRFPSAAGWLFWPRATAMTTSSSHSAPHVKRLTRGWGDTEALGHDGRVVDEFVGAVLEEEEAGNEGRGIVEKRVDVGHGQHQDVCLDGAEAGLPGEGEMASRDGQDIAKVVVELFLQTGRRLRPFHGSSIFTGKEVPADVPSFPWKIRASHPMPNMSDLMATILHNTQGTLWIAPGPRPLSCRNDKSRAPRGSESSGPRRNPRCYPWLGCQVWRRAQVAGVVQ